MPHADPARGNEYRKAWVARRRAEPGENGERFRQQQRDTWRRYRERNRERLREADATIKRLKRSLETPEAREARLIIERANRTQDEMAFRNLTKRIGEFGMTLDQYHSMMESQNFSCAICHKAFVFGVGSKARQSGAHLDHCHTTNRVRGLLCANCNVGIGHLQESPRLFQRAAAYVKRHRRLF